MNALLLLVLTPALAATAPVAVTPLKPAVAIACPEGPACKSFRELAAAGDANVLNATWACFYDGKAPVDPGEDDPPAGRDAQDRFFLIHYSKPAAADSDTNGPVYEQLVRYGKTDDADHVSAWKDTYAGGLEKAVKDPALKMNYGELWMAYADRPAALTFTTIEFIEESIRCRSLARQTGKTDEQAKADCAHLATKKEIRKQAWERRIAKSSGAFTERTVPLDKELSYVKKSEYAGRCLRLK